jgi:tRNA modification GTPase
VVEFQGHGGPVVLDHILNTLLKLGARLAEPGEFSLRAYLNGKIDLLQAEAIADLIDASSQGAQKGALQSLQGVFSQEIKRLNEQVIHLRVLVEAALDFPEEEIDFISELLVVEKLEALSESLNTIFETAKQGSLLKEGKTVVIVGEPNVGKSSLLNKLAEKELAIVTNIPGTTRDIIKEHILIDGFPLYIIDTAGIRESFDLVEKEGIKRAKDALESADIILHMQVILSNDKNAELDELLTVYQDKVIRLVNKIDLCNQDALHKEGVLYLSVKEDKGLDLLKQAIKQKMGVSVEGGVYSARRRHLVALEKAHSHLENGKTQIKIYKAAELLAQELRFISNALEELTGEFSTEDLLGEIFSSFCIGK